MPELLTNLVHRPLTADPGSPRDGEAWYRSDLGQFRIRMGSATQVIGPRRYIQTWNMSGAAAIVVGNTDFYPKRAGRVVRVWISLGTAGTTTTTVDLNLSGTTMFASGKPNVTTGVLVSADFVPATPAFASTDFFTPDVDAAGTGALDLIVYMEWEES